MLNFKINDIVKIKGRDELMIVCGVIHDDERSFVYDNNDQKIKEVEVKFNDVL
jgi:hypothetical protein